jgi:hypothetical protein
MIDPNKRVFSAQEMQEIKEALGTGLLTMDSYGNIIDRDTGMIIMPNQTRHTMVSNEQKEAAIKEKAAIKAYFRNLPKPVKAALIEQALAHKIEKAAVYLNDKAYNRDSDELWSLSYEEMSKIAAEGILLDDD